MPCLVFTVLSSTSEMMLGGSSCWVLHIELHMLNLFLWYQALMSLTMSIVKKQSSLMFKMCSLLPLDLRVHKSDCLMFKGFFPWQGRQDLAVCLLMECEFGLPSSSSWSGSI